MRRGSRLPALLCALGAVATLHATAGWGLAVALQPPGQGRVAAPPPAVLQLLWLPGEAAEAPAPATAAALAATPTPVARPVSRESTRHTAQHPGHDDPRPPPSNGEAAETLDGPPAPPGLYLASHEVDEPARPLTEWALDAEALAQLGVQRLVFHAWIDADGHWAMARVTEIEPPQLLPLAGLLAERLMATPMQAARRGGERVPHQLRIELQLADAPSGAG